MVRQKSVVTNVDANGAFLYLWLLDHIGSTDGLQSIVSSTVATLQPETNPIRPGATLMAKAADHQFYRVRIIRPSFEYEGHYRCFFVDYGNFDTLPFNKLFKLPSKLSLQIIPQQARCYMLDGIVAKTAENWPDNVMASLRQRLVDREFFVEELGVCGPYPVVQLFDVKSNVNIVDILANAGLGRRESSYGRWISYIPPNPKLQSGATLLVQITEVESATDFQVTVEPGVIGVDIKTIMLATAKAQKQPLLAPILPQTLCLARIESPVDGISFFRAEILGVESPASSNVHIRLMDLGKKVCLPLSNLHAMVPELLKLPFLSLHMCLAGLELTSDDHTAATQLEWLRGLCFRHERVAVTILHTLSPNFYAVAINEMGIISLSPLPFRLLPMLGQRPFDVFLKRSLAPCSFNEPVLPAVLNSSLPSYDTLMAAFLSFLAVNPLTKLPPSAAARSGVFCIAFDQSADGAPYPLRCVISTPIMGSQMRCLLYEIDTGGQMVRSLDEVYIAPTWAFAHPSFCVPVVAFDAQGKPAIPKASLIQARAIHREPVAATPAGIIVIQETVVSPPTFDNNRSLPVIEEVIIDDWADTASETASSTIEDVSQTAAEVDRLIPQEAVADLVLKPDSVKGLVKLEPVSFEESDHMLTSNVEDQQLPTTNGFASGDAAETELQVDDQVEKSKIDSEMETSDSQGPNNEVTTSPIDNADFERAEKEQTFGVESGQGDNRIDEQPLRSEMGTDENPEVSGVGRVEEMLIDEPKIESEYVPTEESYANATEQNQFAPEQIEQIQPETHQRNVEGTLESTDMAAEQGKDGVQVDIAENKYEENNLAETSEEKIEVEPMQSEPVQSVENAEPFKEEQIPNEPVEVVAEDVREDEDGSEAFESARLQEDEENDEKEKEEHKERTQQQQQEMPSEISVDAEIMQSESTEIVEDNHDKVELESRPEPMDQSENQPEPVEKGKTQPVSEGFEEQRISEGEKAVDQTDVGEENRPSEVKEEESEQNGSLNEVQNHVEFAVEVVQSELPEEIKLIEIPLDNSESSTKQEQLPQPSDENVAVETETKEDQKDLVEIPLNDNDVRDDVEEKPLISVVVEAPDDANNETESLEEYDDGTTEITEVPDIDDKMEDQAMVEGGDSLTVTDRSAFEKQHSVPARMLSENAVSNQLLSPSCPFTIMITPPSRTNSMEPNTEVEETENTQPDTTSTEEVENENTKELAISIEAVCLSSEASDTGPPSFCSESPLPLVAEKVIYSYPNLLPFESISVTISHIPEDVLESKQFWVRSLDDYDSVRSHYISTYLSDHGGRLPLVEAEVNDILPGFCCLATGALNGKLFRAEVLEIDHWSAKVLCVDSGRTEICQVSRLKVCPDELFEVPRLAYHCVASEATTDILGSLDVDSKRSIRVVSYDEASHIHEVNLLMVTIDSLPQMSFNERMEAEYPYEISYIDSPNQFYVKLLSFTGVDDKIQDYAMMERYLQETAANIFSLQSEGNEWADRLVVVSNVLDGYWKRAVILASESDINNRVVDMLVQLIDSGKTETIPFDRIRPITLERFDLPPRVASVNITNADAMKKSITSDMVGQTIVLKLLDVQFDGRHLMQFKARCCDPRFLEEQPVMTADAALLRTLPAYSLDFTGSTQRVQITHFESLHDDLFVQLESDLSVVEDIIERLNLLNDNPAGGDALRVIETPQLGHVYASRFPEGEEESMLYRCEVVSLDPLTVFYVDYGNTEEVTRLFELPSDDQLFWRPPLVHRCRLLQTAKSLLEYPEHVEEALQEPDARVDLLFCERFPDEKPPVYTCEVIIPPVEEPPGLPDYPSLTDGIYSPTNLGEDGTIWLQSEDLGLNLIQLESDLQMLCEDNDASFIPLTNFTVGKPCIVATRTPGDMSFARGEITHVEPLSLSILRIDYGTEETYQVSDIKSNKVNLYSAKGLIAHRIFSTHRLAVPCKLLDDTDAFRRLRLSDFPHVSYMVTFARSISGSAAPPFLVDLRALDDRSSTTTPGYRGPLSACRPTAFMFPSPVVEPQTKTIIGSASNIGESGFGDNVFDEESAFESPAFKGVNNLFKPAFSDGSRFKAICVYLASETSSGAENSDIAFFHDESRSGELNKLYEALSDISRLTPINFTDISVGLMVAARYSVDQFWYRAIVLTRPLNRDAGLTVYFIDYGNTEKIPSSTAADIRQLPPSLSPNRIKPLAIAVRPFSHPHAPATPIRFQLDESYTLEVVSSNGYLTGIYAAASRIPVLIANVVGSSSTTPLLAQLLPQNTEQKVLSSSTVQPLVQPKQEPQMLIPTTIQSVMAAVTVAKPTSARPEVPVKMEPLMAPDCMGHTNIIRHTSAELRKLKQTTPSSLVRLMMTNLENIVTLGILRISVPPAAASEYFQHDNRLLLPSGSSTLNVVPTLVKNGGGAFSVRPFQPAQLPKSCSNQSFGAKVVWVTDDTFFIQLETDESFANFELVDSLSQKFGFNGVKLNENEAPLSLLNKGFLAQWVMGDGRWYRALVRSVVDSTAKPPKVDVLFVDFGNTDVLPITDLVLLSDQTSDPDQRQLLTVPVLSLPIVKGSFNVKNDDMVKICFEWRPLDVPPYTLKSLEIA